jgi:hypothetical protein
MRLLRVFLYPEFGLTSVTVPNVSPHARISSKPALETEVRTCSYLDYCRSPRNPVSAGLCRDHRTSVMSGLTLLVTRWPHRELSIRRLFASSADFRTICEDYEEALRALQHWQAAGSETKAEEYRSLAAEIETEIVRMLDRSTESHP